MTLRSLLEWGEGRLVLSDVPEAQLCAWYLLQACFDEKLDRSRYFLRKEEEVCADTKKKFEAYIEKRSQRVPLEYITGYTEFMGLPFEVDEHVLIPRQDTETLVEIVYPLCGGKRVLDLCTGSGCIGLSIGVWGRPSQLVLGDISEEALCVAKRNLKRFREGEHYRCHTPTELVRGDLFENIRGVFDWIVSNPPYIESDTIPGLMPEVARFEPVAALDGGRDGLDFYREIIRQAPFYLADHGTLCFEIGHQQGGEVSALMRGRGFEEIEIRKDLAGNDRVVLGVMVRGKVECDV
ncbi:MAG: peptide chain release factor N(5)-glutamine methyltransferase [Eubacterium sp.]|jgi:release factor glutamine methyltransferase|nr:peptide chain release factor N(5)-glutamine methyltransferase [Eubacterium sp.]